MEKKELDAIIEKHVKWLKDEDGGERAYLHGANLQGAYLHGANLQGANLQGANLQGANLHGADLQGADLQGANLQGAYLHGANLQGANLQGAYLHGANLQGAYLHGANLQGANLQGADLQGANLDFSCLPMWCGGSRFKCSPALIRQIFAHVCSLEVIDADDETKAALLAIRKEAEKSHRAGDLGLLEGK